MQLTNLTVKQVVERLPLLERIMSDYAAAISEASRLSKRMTFFDRATSPEAVETHRRLLREVGDQCRAIEAMDEEVKALDGVVRFAETGRVYFFSDMNGDRIFLVWDATKPNAIYWHPLDQSYEDKRLAKVLT